MRWLTRHVLERTRQTPLIYGGLLVLARSVPVIPIFAASVLLPDDEFGALAVLVTSVTTASLVADSGTDSAAGWLASHASSQAKSDRILSALLYSRVTIAAAATVILTLPQTPFLPGDGIVDGFVLMAAVSGNCLASWNAAKRVRMRIIDESEPRAMLLEKLTVGLVFVAWLVFMPHSGASIMWGYLASTIVGPLVAVQPISKIDLRSSFGEAKTLLVRAAPFIVTTLSAAITWRTSTFVLAHDDQLAQAAYLTLAYYPVQLFASIPASAAPLLLVKRRSEALSFKQTAKVAFSAGLLVAVALFAGAILIRQTGLASSVNSDAIHSLQILVLAMPFIWLNPILASYLRLRAGVWQPTVTISICGIAAVIAAIMLVPATGAVGAACVITGAETLSCLLLLTRSIVQRQRGSVRYDQ